MIISRLEYCDYYGGYLNLLSQLTETDLNVSYELFCKQFDLMNSDIFIMRDENNKVVASGSIFIEKKFIRGFRSVGHIEDVVVDINYRGSGIGSLMINYLTQYAKDNNCYKVILDCSDENVKFYKKCGYSNKGIQMALYL